MTQRGTVGDMPHEKTLGLDGNPFQSFWMGGFEGADHVNSHGVALDMAAAHGHVEQLEDDHRRAASLGLRTIRESIGWRLAEPAPGHFDLDRTLRIADSARRHGLQVIWTLMHYGTPPDISLFDDALDDRFARFARAVAEALQAVCTSSTGPVPVFNPINEIGFLAWAVSETSSMSRTTTPAPQERVQDRTLASGYAVKRRLVRASLRAMTEIRKVCPSARFIQIEPVVHVVARDRDDPAAAEVARTVAAYQWQVWDLFAGGVEPALGGHAGALDIVGVNHYHNGQWEMPGEARLTWPTDARRRPLSRLLHDVWSRYGRPLLLAETSHVGEGRSAWLDEVASEVRRARRADVPVQGICLYPLIDRPDWNAPAHWHRSGLWDIDTSGPSTSTLPATPGPGHGHGPMRRVLSKDYASSLQRWQSAIADDDSRIASPTCLIVFSHLRWGFVYQRPQQLMSRLSRHHRVLFIEEPVFAEGEPLMHCHARGPNVDVLVPHTPVAAPGFHDDQLALLEPMISRYLSEQGIADCVAWLYTPMALPLLAALRRPPTVVVYDCMDDLAAFRHAPKQLRQRETVLLQTASLVFTGGPTLFEAKRALHPHVHCLPSSVDAGHFSPHRLDFGCAEAADAERLQGGLASPRLGFFGVVDERFDTALLAHIAEARPAWQFVIVGPVVKIDPGELPQRANIHWLGMQAYGLLPYLLAGWDVCLMPFAMNESTRCISPTKTLEYMAGEKPIVSTPVPDVISLYGDTVRIAAGPVAFVAACEAALAERGAARNRRIGEMLATVSCASWERSAENVHRLLTAELAKPRPSPLPLRSGGSPPFERVPNPPPRNVPAPERPLEAS